LIFFDKHEYNVSRGKTETREHYYLLLLVKRISYQLLQKLAHQSISGLLYIPSPYIKLRG